MRGIKLGFGFLALVLAGGCGAGGSTSPGPSSASPTDSESTQESQPASTAKSPDSESTKGDDQPASGTPKKTQQPTDVDPKFTDGMTVEQAIKAVPQGVERENLEEEVMNKPLLDPSIYAPCKLSPSQHFNLRFALWDGRVVGMDLTTTPKSAKVESCVRDIVTRATWRQKVRSLNISTVTF